MADEFEYYFSILKNYLHPDNQDKSSKTVNTKTHCEICLTELLLDYANYVNICPKCSIAYPYFENWSNRIRSAPYKRKWHFMTCIRKLEFPLRWYELERLMSTYIKLDHAYNKQFPGKNMVNILFVIKYISLVLGYARIAQRISIKANLKTKLMWYNKLNLVLPFS